ncbi:MAG: hypothetical protein ACI9LO_000051 [Planctomycetota bacterium]|jgi:hypothetical protein
MIEELIKQDQELTRAKINSETAKIAWSELQRHFASGNMLFVSAQLDLVEVAFAFHEDDAQAVEQWMSAGSLSPANDEQARNWYQQDSSIWAVVVKPWVLVQDVK